MQSSFIIVICLLFTSSLLSFHNMGLGHIITAMPPIHAIPAVVAAPPGIATYNDLQLTLPRGIVPKG